jgi:hypothetical protein
MTRRRVAHVLIFTAVYSRDMFIWLTFSQTLEALIAGCEQAWRFFGGVFGVLIPDNLSPVIAGADAVNLVFTMGWLDYAQHAGFATDPARVRWPTDKLRVERMVQYVRGNFFAGEDFADLADAQVCEECPVGSGEAGFVNLALQDDELVAQRQDLDVLVDVAHRQQPYDGEQARECQVGQSQQHDASSWRTPPWGLQMCREPAGYSPWIGFSAPTGYALVVRRSLFRFPHCVIRILHALSSVLKSGTVRSQRCCG